MVEAGVPIHEALFFLEEGETNPLFRRMIENVGQRVAYGHTVSEAFRREGPVFGPMTVELISVGEQNGLLVVALQRIAQIGEQQRERVNRVKQALTYPACLAVVMLVVLYLFITFVSPADSGLFAALGSDIPWPSQVLIDVSSFLGNPLWMFLLVLTIGVGVLALRRLLVTNGDFRLVIHTILLRTPGLGSVLAKLEVAQTLDVISSSLRVGGSLLVALQGATRVAKNEKYRHDLLAVSKAIKYGEGLGSAFQNLQEAPPYLTAMLEVADVSGNLENILKALAKTLEEEATSDLDRAVQLLEPLLLALSGLVAGFIAVATLLPVIRLVGTL